MNVSVGLITKRWFFGQDISEVQTAVEGQDGVGPFLMNEPHFQTKLP